MGFWEPRRLIYNAVLLALTLWVLARPDHLPRLLSLKIWCELVVCVGIANLCFCAAYPLDFLLQYATGSTGLWRNTLFLLGQILAVGFAATSLDWMLNA